MTAQTRHYVATAAAILCFVGGILLSRRIEPGVSVTTVTLAGDTPALRFQPAGSGPHPVALLAHGYSGSKENLFVYGEALAKAEFECYSVDLPGHGASPRLFSTNETVRTLGEVARAIGPVDVYLGHSMGGSKGGDAVFEGLIQPKLFIAVGSMPVLGEHGPPLLLLAGRFDPYCPSAVLQTRTNAQLVISPWSEHGLEIIDPILVDAAVKAACAAVGKTPPDPALAWLWRVFGGALAVGGALGLALCLPKLPARAAWLRGVLVAALLMIALRLADSMGVDKTLHWPHVPYQAAGIIVTFLLLLGATRLRLPRWGFLALAIVFWLGCVLSLHFLNLHLTVFRLVLSLMFLPVICTGTLLAWIADRKGTRRDGDVAMAIFVGCILFQWGEPPRTGAPEPVPKSVTQR